MPASEVTFQMLSADKGSQPRYVDVVLTVTRASDYSRRSGWKAVMSIRDQGKKKRVYGAWRLTIVDAALSLLVRYASRIRESEKPRLMNAVAAIQERRAANLPTRAMGSQPIQASDPAPQPRTASGSESPAPSQASCPENAVCCVHQIYGLFGDDKPMSKLFQTSNRMWKEVAAGMGAQYVPPVGMPPKWNPWSSNDILSFGTCTVACDTQLCVPTSAAWLFFTTTVGCMLTWISCQTVLGMRRQHWQCLVCRCVPTGPGSQPRQPANQGRRAHN